PPHAARAQSRLDVLALVWQVASPIAADDRRPAGVRIEALVQIAAQHLDRGARLREADGLHAPANQPLGDPLAGEQRRRSNPELLVGDGWVHDQYVLPPAGSAVVVDQLDRSLEEPLRQIPRVGDGGAGADE